MPALEAHTLSDYFPRTGASSTAEPCCDGKIPRVKEIQEKVHVLFKTKNPKGYFQDGGNILGLMEQSPAKSGFTATLQ